MMSTCTHNGPMIHCKAQTDMYYQWKQYQIPTANQSLPLVSFHHVVMKFTWPAKSTLEKADQLTLVNVGSELA